MLWFKIDDKIGHIGSVDQLSDMQGKAMAKRTLRIVAISLLFCGFVPAPGAGVPRVEFESRELDFGEIDQGERVTDTLRFKNVGDDTLVIEKVRTSCGCTAAVVSSKRIAPKEIGEIRVTFNSGRFKGKVGKRVYVYSNDPDNPTVHLTVSANVIPEIRFYLFYSKDCEACDLVHRKILPPLEEKYNLNMKSFDLDDLKNYELLVKFEEEYDDTDNEVPVVVIGEYILGGPEEIGEQLAGIVDRYRQKGCNFPSLQAGTDTTIAGTRTVYLAYFYSEGCRECDRITYELRYLSHRYPNLVIKDFDMGAWESKRLNEALCELYKVPLKLRLVTPMVFVGEEFLAKREISRRRLETLIRKYQLIGSKIPWEEAREFEERSGKSIRDRFHAMNVLTVLSAGLIDGVNPCAMAAVVFFISFLSFIGKRGKDLLWVGISFTLAVYITYLLIGVGIFRFLRELEFTSLVGKVIFSGSAGLALIFGVLSVYDYFKFRRGKYEEAKLKLPKFLKKRIDGVIRQKMGMRNYILAALVIGFLISITEFVCTGQVYLPTILFVSGVPQLRMKGLAYLFLYNLAFVVPLVVVFGAAYRGTTSMDLNLFWRKHAKSVKLVTSFLFFLLAGLLIFYAYR